QRDFFATRQRTDSLIRQKFELLNSKANFVDFESARFQGLSTSIGRFAGISSRTLLSSSSKKTVRHDGRWSAVSRGEAYRAALRYAMSAAKPLCHDRTLHQEIASPIGLEGPI